MKTEITEMTVTQAIVNGYTLACNEEGAFSTPLIDVDNDEIDDSGPLYLASIETIGFSGFSVDEIHELLQERLDGQEEVDNQDGHLDDQLCNVDFEAIAKAVNAVFIRRYYEVTDIQLIKED